MEDENRLHIRKKKNPKGKRSKKITQRRKTKKAQQTKKKPITPAIFGQSFK